MKKNKLKIVFAVIFVVIAACALFACGGSAEPEINEPKIKQFDSNVKLEGKEVTYDGSEQELRLSGNLPAGATTTYENNGQTDAGEYTVKVTVSCDGYETKTYTAKLKINKADFKMDGIEFKGKTFFYKAGTERKVELTDGDNETVTESDFPDGTEIKYTENKKINIGDYGAKVTISNKNYNEIELSVSWKITTLKEIIDNIKEAVKDKPSPLKFLPQALQPENMSVGTTAPSYDFANSFVNVADINKKYIGKQLNVVYDLIENSEKVFAVANAMNATLSTITNTVQTFLENLTDGFEVGTVYSLDVKGFKAAFIMNGEETGVLLGASNVNGEFYYNHTTKKRAARIQVVAGDIAGASVKYVASDNYLALAYCADVMSKAAQVKQLEFERKNGVVNGYLHEYVGTIDTDKKQYGIRSSAVIRSDSSTTVIVSDKRETDDLKINGYEEVYDSVTGRYLGGEVDEFLNATAEDEDGKKTSIVKNNYDTLWFNLHDVGNFVDNVKVDKKQNGMNADTIYINDSVNAIHSQWVSNFLVKPTNPDASRRFDIEMKDVYYVVKETKDEKTTYKRVKSSVPMLFIQNAECLNGNVLKVTTSECIKDFPSNWVAKNYNKDSAKSSGAKSTRPTLPSTDKLTERFTVMKTTFTAVKENISYASIKATIGQPNTFFTSTAE